MPPVNDNLANATVLSGPSGSIGDTLVGATIENGPYTMDGFTELAYWGVPTVADGRSVWYKYTAASDVNLVLDIVGTGFHPYVETWVEDSPGVLTFVDWFGDGTSDPSASNPIPIPNGVTLYIVIDNWEFDTSEGSFTLDWEVFAAPPNDNIANAILISSSGDIITASTVGATTEVGEDTYGNNAIWYKWFPPSSGVTATLTKLAESQDHAVRIYQSNVGDNADYGDLGVQVAQVSDPPIDTAQFTTQSIWYYIIVVPDSTPGTVSFSLTLENETDTHDDGTVYLPTQPRGWSVGNNVGTTTEVGEPTHAGVGTHHSAWYYFEPTHVGTYTFTIERVWGDLENPVLAAYTNPFDVFGAMTELDSNATTPLPSITFTINDADRFDDIAIVVAGRAEGQEGGYVISWNLDSVEPNDNFENAIEISGTGSLTDRDLDGAMLEIGDYFLFQYSGQFGNHWYKFIPDDDGSIELTIDVGTLLSQRVWVWKGTVREDLVAIAYQLYNAGPTSKLLKLPVEAGQTYYIEVYGTPQYTYDISWEINTDAPVDFQPTSVGDFDTNSGGSDSAGELVFGPTDYVQHTILPSGHSRATDHIYVGFNIRYGNSNRMLAGSGDQKINVLEIYSVSNTLIGGVKIYEDLGNLEITGHLECLGGGTSVYKLSEDNIYCEFVINNVPSDDYTTSAKDMSMIIQGTELTADNTSSPSTQLIGYIKLGYINEPATAPNLDLRFSDIVVKTIHDDEGLPDPPFYADPNDRLFFATGFNERQTTASHMGRGFRNTTMATAYTIIDDPTGGGKGAVVDASSAAKTVAVPGLSSLFGGIGKYRVTAGWWVYLTTIGSGGILATVTGTQKGTLNATFLALKCQSDGTLYIETDGGVNGVLSRAYSHRVMETGSWHHIEIEVTRNIPRTEGRWWIDGEEQEPIIGDRGTGRAWSFMAGFSISLTSSLRGYITDITSTLKEHVGPIKSSIVSPDASGTHDLGTITHYTEGDGTETFITSIDDGTTYTSLGATDPVHGFIDEWPNNDSTSTSDMIGDVNRSSYIEYTYADVGGGEDVLFINAFTAVRPMHIMTVDFTGLHTYPDLIPHSRDQSDTGAMISTSKFLLGSREVNQLNEYSSGFDTNYRVSQIPLGHAPDGELWTPSKVNSMIARWGYQHWFTASPQQGNALEAQMMEIIMAETVSVSLDEYVPPAPEINLVAQQFDNQTPPYAFNSCLAWSKTDLRTDPNMSRKIWLFPTYVKEWESFRLFWRVTPAYDADQPGFDGVYNNNQLSKWLLTSGEFYGDIANNLNVSEERWGNNYYITNEFTDWEMRVMSPSLIYNPCALGALVDEDGNITFEAFIRDSYGIDSDITTLVVNITRGDCCGGALMFNKIVALR